MAGKSAAKVKVNGSEIAAEAPQKTAIESSTALAPAPVELKGEVGSTAGKVWHTLSSEGPLTLAQLRKKVDAGGEVVSLAIGWLAREDKVDILPEKRTLRIALR